MISRVGAYAHNLNAATAGGALIRVSCQTDFAANTEVMKAFVDGAAMRIYAANSDKWDKVTEMFPDMAEQFEQLKAELKEKVAIEEIILMPRLKVETTTGDHK